MFGNRLAEVYAQIYGTIRRAHHEKAFSQEYHVVCFLLQQKKQRLLFG